jgi:RimJ/RimL family protein N-acetyltransferase
MGSVFETERLRFVNIRNDDVDDLLLITSDSQTMRYFSKTLNYQETSEFVNEILDHYDKYGYCFWKILLKESKVFIGIAGLLHHDLNEVVEMEIAYRIKREYWGNGFATETARACKEYAKDILCRKRLISIIHPENVKSIRVAKKLGAERKSSMIFNGVIHDVYVYS